MIAAISLLVVLVLSMLITRVGAVALRLTGMSNDAARFQARSAFTGAGFTTTESEQIVTHPVRRRIVAILMLLGNLGIVAASSTLIVSLVGIESGVDARRLIVLGIGLVLLYFVGMSKAVDRVVCGMISWALSRYSDIETRDFSTLLHLRDDYRIAELHVDSNDWMANKTLGEMQLRNMGVIVLGIVRPNGEYEGAPDENALVSAGDRMILYGLPTPVEELDCRCTLSESGG